MVAGPYCCPEGTLERMSDEALDRAAFAEALVAQMARVGTSKRDLGRAARISESTIGNYCRGERTPRFPELLRLAKALDIDATELAGQAMAVRERMRGDKS